MILEICTASVDDCRAAQAGGADRVELNTALMLGGLTPSLGTIREARSILGIPMMVMIRPRSGGFCYSEGDLQVMQRDVDLVLEAGADGVAVGVLTSEGRIDLPRLRGIVRQAAGAELVFHRAFDVVPEPIAALDALIDLGFTRVMTSGQRSSAPAGSSNIAGYIAHVRGRIEILPAGGINRHTVKDVVAQTGCNQVHASLSMLRVDTSTRARPEIVFGASQMLAEDQYKATDPDAVVDLRKRLDALVEP